MALTIFQHFWVDTNLIKNLKCVTNFDLKKKKYSSLIILIGRKIGCKNYDMYIFEILIFNPLVSKQINTRANKTNVLTT